MGKSFNCNRLRRAKKIRKKIYELNMPRLMIHKTAKHLYAQIISSDNEKVLASSSTVGKSFFSEYGLQGKSLKAAETIGKIIAEKAKSIGLDKVAFDRSGFKYHGMVRVFSDTARSNGLIF